jgi:CheY-like chemotaxis protein
MEFKTSYTWKDKQILIVEDDESSSYLLGEILKGSKATLAYSTNGNEAVDYVRKHPDTDIVLMDINLPDMDGITATRLIKGIRKKIVVFAQSAYTSFSDQEHAREAGCDEFIVKPINPYLLLSKINKYLG